MVLAITLPYLGDVDNDLLMAEVGLFVAGLSAIVGMWVERDMERPVRNTISPRSMLKLTARSASRPLG